MRERTLKTGQLGQAGNRQFGGSAPLPPRTLEVTGPPEAEVDQEPVHGFFFFLSSDSR